MKLKDLAEKAARLPVKDAFSVRLKRWLCGRIPSSEMAIEHREIDTIDVHSDISFNDLQGLSDADIELLIVRQMIPEIKKYVAFIDIEMHDGTKCKHGILKVVQATQRQR